jgi:hypothetical protein
MDSMPTEHKDAAYGMFREAELGFESFVGLSRF